MGRKPIQVFTEKGSFGILSNEFVDIWNKSEEIGIYADTLDDNIYQWIVKLKDFPGASDLHDSLCLLY